MRKILIAAFEPCGLTGKFIRKANAGKDVLKKIREQTGERFSYSILPVCEEARERFALNLQMERPSGVLCVMEHMLLLPGTVKLESSSDFDEGCSSSGSQNSARIWRCHTQQVLKTARDWSMRNNNIPVHLAYVSVMGDRDRQKNALLDLAGKIDGIGGLPPVCAVS